MQNSNNKKIQQQDNKKNQPPAKLIPGIVSSFLLRDERSNNFGKIRKGRMQAPPSPSTRIYNLQRYASEGDMDVPAIVRELETFEEDDEGFQEYDPETDGYGAVQVTRGLPPLRRPSIVQEQLSTHMAPKEYFSMSYISLVFHWVLDEIPRNLGSSATVSLVNVPLSIALSIAGGGTPVCGIVTAFWGGLAAAIFGGSEFNIVGPTGALSGILSAAAAIYGPEVLPWLSIWTGVMCFFVWYFRLIDYILFVPNSVMHGFTFGVAFLIGFGQLDAALGLSFKHTYSQFYLRVAESLYYAPTLTKKETVIFFLFNFSALVYLIPKYPKIPWAVIFTIIGIVVGMTNTQPGAPLHELITLQDRYGDFKLSLLQFPKLVPGALSKDLIYSSFAVSFIAVLETLISARMADEMTKTDHSRQQEVFGVTCANLMSGLFGGLPATAALARTSVNINAGATSRVSAFMGTFLLLLISVLLIPYFKFVPMGTIAAILFVIAYRMIDVAHLLKLWHHDRLSLGVALLTAVVCIVEDTMTGLVTGSLISLLMYMQTLSTGHASIQLYRHTHVVGYVDSAELDALQMESLLFTLINQFKRMKDRAGGYVSLSAASPSPRGAGTGTGTGTESEKLHHQQQQQLQEGKGRRRSISTGERKKNFNPRNARRGVFRLPLDVEIHKKDHLLNIDDVADADTLVYRIASQMTYVNATAHHFRTKKILHRGAGRVHTAILCFETVWNMDLDGAEALQDIIAEYDGVDIKVAFAGVQDRKVRAVLLSHEFFRHAMAEGLVFETTLDAIQHLSIPDPNINI